MKVADSYVKDKQWIEGIVKEFENKFGRFPS